MKAEVRLCRLPFGEISDSPFDKHVSSRTHLSG
jgi:hypothetical protein